MSMLNRIAVAIDKRNSNCQFTDCYPESSIDGMDRGESRVAKLKSLVEKNGGPAEFARKNSRDDADKPIDATYVSQILNGHRAFGEKAATNMARRAGLPLDYFDSHEENYADDHPAVVYQTREELIETLIANLSAQSADELRATLLEIELGVVRAKQNRNNAYLPRLERRVTSTPVDKERRGSPILFREMIGEGIGPDGPPMEKNHRKNEQ
jgi:hypothetical protein